jgi:hypothetical protein
MDGERVNFSDFNTCVKLRGNIKPDTKAHVLVVTRIQPRSEYGKPVGSSRYDMLTLSNVVWPWS